METLANINGNANSNFNNMKNHYCPVKAGKSVFEIVET